MPKAGWQNAPGGSPTSTDSFLYDGEGTRVAQQTVVNGTTTTTVYVGNLEQVATTGGTTTTTSYYYAGQTLIALAVNGTFSYLATDALGSVAVAFNASGTQTAAALYTPYGGTRYSSGTMPTDRGWTGQHADAATGLDYFGARCYDPVAAQFTSADTTLPGNGSDALALSRYAYVEGNPLTRLDPTGHDWFGSLVTAVVQTTTAVVAAAAPIVSQVAPIASQVLDATTGIPSMIHDVQTICSGKASTFDKLMAAGDLLLNVAMDVSMVVGVGEGQRVEQQVTASGTTTTTLYLSNLEEVAITGSTTTNTAYFYANGQRIALSVNGSISYLGDDGLGSATTTLDSSGNAQASGLYMPYGGGRWGSGTMPTRRLYTGQVSDERAGLLQRTVLRPGAGAVHLTRPGG